MIRPMFCILTASFAKERRQPFDLLYAELRPQCERRGFPLHVHYDEEAKGSLGPWLKILEHVAASDATHMVFLSDDSILVPHFVDVITKCIEAKPEAIICCQSNHCDSPKAYEAGARWYETPDGFTAFGGTLPRAWIIEHLNWRRETLKADVLVQGDEGVKYWAMATGRQIYKPLPGLVNHDLKLKSLDGNDTGDNAMSARACLVWEPDADLREADWKDGKVVDLGRTYQGEHWKALDVVHPRGRNIARAYDLARGMLVDTDPHVCIATPCFKNPDLGYIRTVDEVIADLLAHGIRVGKLQSPGDSLVTRGRHNLMHQFLMTPATHMLFWDSDIECMDATAVRAMLASGHDVVGGAYPFRDGSGKVVANLSHETRKTRRVTCDETGCCEVSEIGTGFLMVSRKAILEMASRYPETYYKSDCIPDFGTPRWALFDVGIRDERYLSEDWLFCHRWQDMGGKVMCYVPATFRHWGMSASEGEFMKAYGFKRAEAPGV